MTLNYIGSKKSLLSFLEIPLSNIITKNSILLDGFAGTGIVGSYFHNKYNNITIANDLEYYSYIINYATLCIPYSDNIKTIIEIINNKLNTSLLIDKYNLITNNYSPKGNDMRMFWTEENATKCDYTRYLLDNMLEEKEITNEEHKFVIASLLLAMDKVANTASVYGAYLKKFKKSALKQLVLHPIHTNKKLNNKNIVHNNDINSEQILNNKYDIVYLDPPYNERQYSSNYHPLNYIAMYNESLELYGKTGLIKNYNKSQYCNKKSAIDNLTYLINNLKTKHILLSYNNEGIMDINKVKQLLINQGDVILYKKKYKKFKSQSVQEDEQVYEYLFHCNKSENKTFKEIIID
jgi:adenine-specific DNA-methyltransferase